MVEKYSKCTIVLICLAVFYSCKDTRENRIQYSVKSDDPVFYEKYLTSAELFDTKMNEIAAGITSHHLFAGDLIVRFFKTIKYISKNNKSIKTFIIIGPDHYDQCIAHIALSRRVWKTPFGYIDSDIKKIGELRAMPDAKIDEDAFYGEHSIGALLPFIAKFFPGAKIVPIMVNRRLSWDAARHFGNQLAILCNDNDIILLSADFVHNKKNGHAKAVDLINRKNLLIPVKDLKSNDISKMELDCSKGLWVLYSYLKNKDRVLTDILLNTNSAEISGKDVLATSYFFVFYGK